MLAYRPIPDHPKSEFGAVFSAISLRMGFVLVCNFAFERDQILDMAMSLVGLL